MEGEQERRFLAGRYEYLINIYGDKLALQEIIITKMNEKGIQHQHIIFESVSAESTIQLAFTAAGPAIQALVFLHTILKDQKKKDGINVTFTFPNSTVINIHRLEDVELILDRLKQIDPEKDEQERRKTVDYYKKKYRELYKD
jgi:hypothetical protein